MPEIPEAAVQAAESAIRDAVRIRLGERALALASQGQPLMLSGTEAEQAARAALEAAAPFIAEQARREAAAPFRALAARYRSVPDEGLTMGQLWDRDQKALENDRIADEIEGSARA